MKLLVKEYSDPYLTATISQFTDGLVDNAAPVATTKVLAERADGTVETVQIGNLAFAGLPSLDDGNIWIGDGANIAQKRVLSGNVVLLNNTGVTRLQSFGQNVASNGFKITAASGDALYGFDNNNGNTYRTVLRDGLGSSTYYVQLGDDADPTTGSHNFVVATQATQTLFQVSHNGIFGTSCATMEIGRFRSTSGLNNGTTSIELQYTNNNSRSNIISYYFGGMPVVSATRVNATTGRITTREKHYFKSGYRFTLAGFDANWNGTFNVTARTAKTFDFTFAVDPGSDSGSIGTLTNYAPDNVAFSDYEDTFVFDAPNGGGFAFVDNSGKSRFEIRPSGQNIFPRATDPTDPGYESATNDGGLVYAGNYIQIGERAFGVNIPSQVGHQGYALRITKDLRSAGSYSGGEGSAINNPRHFDIHGVITRDSNSGGGAALEANLINSRYTFENDANNLSFSRLSNLRLGNVIASRASTSTGTITITDLSALYLGAQSAGAGVTATNTYSLHAKDKVKIEDNGSSNFGLLEATPNDFEISNNGSGSVKILSDFEHEGTLLGFYNTSPVAKPTVTGSRGGNAALADFLTQMATLGLITDSTVA